MSYTFYLLINLKTKQVNKFIQHPVFKIISEIADEQNREAYVIGGFVRDALLNRPCKDFDILTIGSGIDLAIKVAKRINPKLKVNVFKNFGTAMFKWKNLEVEFVGARRESYRQDSRKPVVEDGTLDDDQCRRDFTINALAIGLHKSAYGKLLDPFCGVDDLQNRIIRTPLEPEKTFSDDPLRMMRAIRFATQLEFHISEKSSQGIINQAERISIISKERIVDEFNKILLSRKPSIGIKLLEKTGLLTLILPEITEMKGVSECEGKSHKDNFLHTCIVVDNVAQNSDNLWLRWAALLHDIGKPETKRCSAHGWTFHGHEAVGANIIEPLFRRMKLPLNDKMKYVKKLVMLHLRPIVLAQDIVTDSAIRRLLFDAGDDTDDLMILCEADITSANDERVRRYFQNFKLVRQKLKEIEEKDAIRNWQAPISGDLIMKAYDLKPCREIGIIKAAIKDAILDGVIANKYEAAYQFMLKKGKEIGLVLNSEYEK